MLLWKNTFSGDLEEIEAFELVKNKTQELSKCQLIWENAPGGSQKKSKAFQFIKTKAEELFL